MQGEGLTPAATRIQPWYYFDLEIPDFRSFREISFLCKSFRECYFVKAAKYKYFVSEPF